MVPEREYPVMMPDDIVYTEQESGDFTVVALFGSIEVRLLPDCPKDEMPEQVNRLLGQGYAVTLVQIARGLDEYDCYNCHDQGCYQCMDSRDLMN